MYLCSYFLLPQVSDAGWKKIVATAQPGSVVRVQHISKTSWNHRPVEQPYALAIDEATGTMGEIEVLTGPPEEELEASVIEVTADACASHVCLTRSP